MNELKSEIQRVFCLCEPGDDKINSLEHVPIDDLNGFLFLIIKSKSFPLLKHVVELGADVNHSEDGVTILHYACQEDELEMAKYLVHKGANPLALCKNGFSLLIYAVKCRSLPLVKWTLEQGCNINQRDGRGLTVLHATVVKMKGNDNESTICDLLQFLLSHGAEVYTNPVSPALFAKENGYLQAEKLLNQYLPKISFFKSYDWMMAPHYVPTMIERGADIHERDEEGLTPLLFAVRGKLIPQALLLIDLGSDIHAVDDEGWGVLHYLSAFNSGPEAVQLTEKLIGMGSDVNQRCFQGSTPLIWHNICKEGSDVAEVLKRHGALSDNGKGN